MLWCKEYCFVHYPKTAGKTLTRFFVQAWPRPIGGYISRGQVNELADCELEKTDIQVGRGHENLAECRQIIAEQGTDILTMKGIFCCIRNPYDLMVSNYFFMRQTYPNNKEKSNFIIAHENDFVDFCEKVGVSSASNWMTLDGKQPHNLRIVRFEHMSDDLSRYAEEFGFPLPELGHLNASKRGHYSEYVNRQAAASIEKKFAYIFDQGYYEKEEFDDVPQRMSA